MEKRPYHCSPYTLVLCPSKTLHLPNWKRKELRPNFANAIWGEDTDYFLRSARKEKKRSFQEGMHELCGSPLPAGRTQNPLASRPLEAATLRSQPASGLGRSRQCLHLSRGRGREKEEARAKPQTSLQLPEGAAGRSCGQVEAEGQCEPAAAGDVGTVHTSPAGARDGGEGSVLFGRCRRRPRTRRGRGQSPSPEPAGPQSRHRRRPRPRSPRLRGRQVLPARARVRPVGRAGSQPPVTPARPGKRSGGAYLARSGRPRWAWLRGPGSNWLPGEGPASPTRSW